MTQPFDHVGTVGKDYVDASLKSLAALSTAVQAIASEASQFAGRSYVSSSASLEKVVAATSLETAFELQSAHARSVYGSMVAQAARMSELYADMAKDACKPFESIIVKAR